MAITFTYGTGIHLDTLGHPYDALMCDGIKEEGAHGPLGHATPEAAWAAYFSALNAYIADNRATAIEWRVPAQLVERDLSREHSKLWGSYPKGSQKYVIYSRLSVIARAPRPPAINEGYAT